MIIAALVATLALGIPDVSRRTNAWRVVDSSFSSYDCSQACTQPQDAARDTACIQHAIDVAATGAGDLYAAVELPPGYCYLNDTLTVDSQWGFELYGRGVHNTQLVWVGAAVTNILELYDLRQANIHDISVYVTTTDADAAIATFNGSGTTVAPTANRFHDLFIEASGGAALADGLRFDDTGPGGDNNQEFYSIERVHVGGYQSNAFNIMGGQMKGLHFADSTCASDAAAPASTCVTSYGCFDWQGGGGGANTYADFSLMNNGCPYVIANANFEQSYRLLYVPGPTGAQTYVTITGTRWSSIGGIARGAAGDARRVVKFLGSGGLTMVGNTIGDDGAGTYTMTADAGTDVITLTGSPDLVVDTPVYFTTSGGLPAPLVANTTYYVKTAPSSSTATLAATAGGATIDLTTAGTGTHTATIANFRPLSFYLYRGTVAAPYVFQTNFIGTNLTGTDLWTYAAPTVSEGNSSINTTDASGAMGSAIPLPADARMPVIHVKDFGATPGDGVDDSAAIRAAVTAACSGCTLHFAAGTYDVATGITIAKNLALEGESPPMTAVGDVYGGAGWNGDNTVGTVLKTTATSGAVITADGTYRIHLANIGLKGPGSGTGTGLALGGTYSPRVVLQNVDAWNFPTCLSLVNVQDSVLTNVQVRGCDTGLYLGLNSNANTILGFDATANNTAVLIDSCSVNRFLGGAIQGSVNYGVRSLGGSENGFDGVYFESSEGGALAMSFESTIGKGNLVFTADAGTDRLTTAEAHGWSVNDIVQVRSYGGTLPTASGGNLAAATDYYVQAIPTSTTLKLSRTLGGGAIDLTGAGSGRMFVGGKLPGNTNSVRECHFGDTGDEIEVWTHGNTFDLLASTEGITFKSGTAGNIARAPVEAIHLTDEGSGNLSETRAYGVVKYTATPYATTETPQYVYTTGPFAGWGSDSTANKLLIENRYDVGYARLLDANNNYSFMDLHFNATPGSRYVAMPLYTTFGANIKVDNAIAGVSTLTLYGDSSGLKPVLTLNNGSDTFTVNATTMALGNTNLTITGGTIDGEDVAGLGTRVTTLEDQGVVYMTSSISDSATLTNSNTETTIKTLTIPANTLKAGDQITQRCLGLVTAYTNGNPTSRTGINNTSGALSNYASLAVSANGDAIELETTYFVQSIGASGEIHGFGTTHTMLTGSSMTHGGNAQAHDQTVDTTANINLVWTVQWSTTNPGNSFVGKGCTVIVYRPN